MPYALKSTCFSVTPAAHFFCSCVQLFLATTDSVVRGVAGPISERTVSIGCLELRPYQSRPACAGRNFQAPFPLPTNQITAKII